MFYKFFNYFKSIPQKDSKKYYDKNLIKLCCSYLEVNDIYAICDDDIMLDIIRIYKIKIPDAIEC